MSEQPSTKKPRIYWIDWHRSYTIWVIALSHALDKSNEVTQKSEKDPIYREWRLSFYRASLQAGMPYFFIFAGMANTFYNGDKPYAYLKFMKVKFLTIIIPFVLAMFILQLPKQFFSQGWMISYREDPEQPNWDFASYAQFWLRKSPLKTIEYLWFLLVIFLIQAVAYPATQFIRRRANKTSIVKHDLILLVGVLLANTAFGLLFAKLIKQDSVEPYLLPSLAVSILGQLSLCFSAWLVIKFEGLPGLSVFYGQSCLVMMGMCYYHPGNEKITLLGLVLQACFFVLFQL